MRRQVQVVALAALLLGAAGCEKQKAAAAADAGPPYCLSSAREGEGLRVEVSTGAGYHVNEEYPVSFSPEGGERMQLEDAAKLTACADAAEGACGLSVAVPNTGGTFAFSVCSKDACLIEKVRVEAK